MAAIALRHVTFITSGKVFVLGGKTVTTERGVATVDLDGPDGPLVALALWHLGYRVDEDGNEIRTVGDLDAIVFADIADQTPADEGLSDDSDPAEDAAVEDFVAALTADAEENPED